MTGVQTCALPIFNETKAAVAGADAAKNAAAKEVVHPARYGTVIWNAAAANQQADSRVAQAIELSVIEEPSPFQLVTDVHRVEANHNRQILVPV